MDTVDLTGMSNLKPAKGYTSTSLFEPVNLRIGKQGLTAIAPQTIPQHFRECCEKYARLPALKYEADVHGIGKNTEHTGQWITVTYAEYAEHVQETALILLHVGLQPRSSVGILAANCPEWHYVAYGTLRAGGVVAGIYPTNSAEAVYHLLDTSEATVCVVDDSIQMAKVRAVRKRLPRLRAVLQLRAPYEDFVGTEEGYYRWENMLERDYGDELRAELQRREHDVGANECASLIYTSGTTGMPKAVMLSHDAILFNMRSLSASIPNIVDGSEVIVSYLPLSHVAPQVFDVYLSLYHGSCIYFADRNALKGSLGSYLLKARPTCFFAVPRVCEKIQEKLLTVEQKLSFMSRYIMQKSRRSMEYYHIEKMAGKSTSAVSHWFASSVMKKIKTALGMDRCKLFLVGGSPASEDLKRFFLSINLPMEEVYGMSESGGCTNLTIDQHNLKSVGKAIVGIEEMIHNPNSEGQGEICIRSRSNFMGYLHSPEKTMETIKDDGWLNSGDWGYIDLDGNLFITGRIKEIIITAGGENIPPVRIEQLIKNELPFLSNAMVVGDHKKYLTVLLTLKTEINPDTGEPLDALQSDVVDWLKSLDLNFTLLSEVLNIPADNKAFDASNVAVDPHPAVVQAIEEGILRANQHAISRAQYVQKFRLLPHDFSVPTGEIGPTLKVRRNIVLQKYANIIDGMYK